jgi:hypothetical protein
VQNPSGILFYGKCHIESDGSLRFLTYDFAMLVAQSYVSEHLTVGMESPKVFMTVAEHGDIVDTYDITQELIEHHHQDWAI